MELAVRVGFNELVYMGLDVVGTSNNRLTDSSGELGMFAHYVNLLANKK